MKMKPWKMLTTAILVLACGATAQAATTLVTPLADTFSLANQITECVVTNFDAKPAVVTVSLFAVDGSAITGISVDTCNSGPLASGTTCFVHANPGQAGCRVVTSTSKVHAALEVWDADTDRLQVMFPATKP